MEITNINRSKMELKEYVAVMKRYKKLFFGIWVVAVFLSVFVFLLQKEKLEATISIELSRSGENVSRSREDGYDQFYRLEADDRFSKAIEQWFSDPNFINSIYGEMKVDPQKEVLGAFSKKFKAERLAPGYLRVRFLVDSPAQAKKIFSSIESQVSKKIELLNSQEKNNPWFKAVFSGPSVASKQLPLVVFLLAGIGGGFLVAFFTVLNVFYWKKEE